MPSALNYSGGSPLSLKVIGHNAGTSMDGVDLVHVHFTQDSPRTPLKMQLLHYGEFPMPKKLKARVMKLIKENKTTPEEMAIVNIQLGEVITDAVKWFAQKNNFSLASDVDLIGGQGQTIWHLPLPELFEGNQSRAHLDMGEIAIIAAGTGVTSLGNFRVSDMALGRQGCPLFAALDSLLLSHPTLNRAVQNIGGIANFSILPRGAVEECYDFDTGPGNVFIDAAVRYFTNGQQEYDKDGAMGQKGKVDQSVVDRVLQGPYFVHDIPKTTGRETFGDRMAEDICDEMLARGATPEDCVATITRITAQSLADAYERWGPPGGVDEIYMGGGGSYNSNIINYLKERMPNTRIVPISEIGIPIGAKEALGFALLTHECFVGRPMIVPKRTESDRPGVVGQIQPGKNMYRIRQHVAQCRKSHAKCDQSRPCALCKRRGIECSLCQDVTFTALEFKAPAAGFLKDFVSKPVGGPVTATFVDETEEVADLYQVTNASLEASSVSSDEHPTPRPVLSSHGCPVTDATDAFFLWRYIDFIGPRFDMFDDAPRYFSTVVPQLALNDPLVLLACVAVAARQYSLVNDQQQHNHEQALTYYNAAIHLLSKRLQDSGPDPAVFASCLLIAHCEMVESKATAWDLHLKGTGDLLKMHGWHGMSGGLAQASFWIYCRMIILASLCAGKPAALEPKEWIPGDVFSDPPTWTLKPWQKKVVFLLGMVHDFWSRTPDDMDQHAKQPHDARWKELEAELIRLQCQAPAVCSPISILPPNGEDNPFQSVRYLNGPVAAAWQMLHTAFLILTICTPSSQASSRLSVLSSPDVSRRAQMYAHQIVANSLVNRCTIAWANAVQLLTIAGQCLVVDAERNACIRVLRGIQQQTGWNTRASIDRLGAAWENGWRYEFRGRHSAVGQVDAGKLLYHVWLGEERSPS
ncbi:hypothetical protein CNMCM8927_003119 [Aspergillus lentulus]|uniref:Zn(2)-C6 fungal-type domain-containing protein n=1 Tax=Aspergillus lentulus TaxID=293939 RepID=A0AAN5YSF4_ASPLE|nr:hypothetical protein CNMCM8927_003119 [Aspergillus lentulus]